MAVILRLTHLMDTTATRLPITAHTLAPRCMATHHSSHIRREGNTTNSLAGHMVARLIIQSTQRRAMLRRGLLSVAGQLRGEGEGTS